MIDYILHKLKEKMNLQDDNEKSDKVIENAVFLSMGAGLIPIPIADLVAVTAVQGDMVRRLAEIYGLDPRGANIESWIGTLSGSVLSKLGAEALKLIPGVGSIVGGVSMAILSGASTYAVGKTFAKHFNEGGDLTNFDVNAVKAFYKLQFEQGKEFAKSVQSEVERRSKKAYSEMKKEGTTNNTGTKQQAKPQGRRKPDFDFEEVSIDEVEVEPSTNQASQSRRKTSAANQTSEKNLLSELRRLAELKEKGMISDAEYIKLKNKIMAQM
ncbi:MAG: DUF697 domain-containing protein [Bernardetiaceae bacterium]|nr:DUF697 domain-containing protein [Bernardetiaceae bacterium]